MSESWFFEQPYCKAICEKFKQRIETKRTSLLFNRLKNDFQEQIAYLVDGLITHGINREPEELASEIRKLSYKLRTSKIIIAYFYLTGPSIRNELTKRLSDIEGYPGRGALELHIIFDFLIPLFKNVYNNFKFDNIEAVNFVKTILFESRLELNTKEGYFPPFEDSIGFIECQYLINDDPLKPMFDKAEELIKSKIKSTFKEAFIKIKSKEIMKKQQLSAYGPVVSESPQPKQEELIITTTPIERFVKGCMVKKCSLNELEENDLEKAIVDVLKGIYSKFAVDISTLKGNQPYIFFEGIQTAFSNYFLEETSSFIMDVKKIYVDNIQRGVSLYKIEQKTEDVSESMINRIKKDSIPSFKDMTRIIKAKVIDYINKVIA